MHAINQPAGGSLHSVSSALVQQVQAPPPPNHAPVALAEVSVHIGGVDTGTQPSPQGAAIDASLDRLKTASTIDASSSRDRLTKDGI